MADVSGGPRLSHSPANTSPFASPAIEVSTRSPESISMAQEGQVPRGVSPGSLPSRPASAQGYRSPSSWFNCTSSSTSSGHPKHSLLAMVPSQPLNRPLGSAPPSPASQLQPPSLPALESSKQPSNIPSLAAALAPSPVSPKVVVPTETSAVPNDAKAVSTEVAEASKDIQDKQSVAADSTRQLKRDRRMRKTEASICWQLMRRLADISSDVELLNHEVSCLLSKHHASTFCVKSLQPADIDALFNAAACVSRILCSSFHNQSMLLLTGITLKQ